jgi:hypothetical protein
MTFPSYGISKGIPVRFCSPGTYIRCALTVGDVSRCKELVIAANSRRRILAFSKPPGKVSRTNRIILIQGWKACDPIDPPQRVVRENSRVVHANVSRKWTSSHRETIRPDDRQRPVYARPKVHSELIVGLDVRQRSPARTMFHAVFLHLPAKHSMATTVNGPPRFLPVSNCAAQVMRAARLDNAYRTIEYKPSIDFGEVVAILPLGVACS